MPRESIFTTCVECQHLFVPKTLDQTPENPWRSFCSVYCFDKWMKRLATKFTDTAERLTKMMKPIEGKEDTS